MTSVCQDGLLFVGDELLGSGCYGNAELAMEIAMENGSFSGVICPKNGEFDSYVYRRVLSSSLKPAAILAMQLLRPIPEQLSSKVFLAEEAIDLSSTKPQSHIAVATLFSNVWGSWLFYVIFWVS